MSVSDSFDRGRIRTVVTSGLGPVDRLASLNLIRVFDFYLAVMFLFSLLRRWRVYRDAMGILVSVRGRWPRLLGRMAQHKGEVLNWATFRPVVLAFGLPVVHWIASR